MTIEAIALSMGILALLFTAALAVAFWRVSSRFDEELALLADETAEQLRFLRSRLASLETQDEAPSPAPIGGQSETPGLSVERATESRFVRVRAGSRPSGSPPPAASVSGAIARDAYPAPPPAALTLERLMEEAAAALASAVSFNEFVARFQGQGFVIEAGGAVPLPPGSPPDRADLHVLPYADVRLVLPAFNLRRAQGLLTSDEGRAAEARLGWLFEIEQGHDLRATRAAFVELNDWTVRRKGRLTIPL